MIHYYEAWLAFLAILIWHMYATVFNPKVYPMNPSWLTGKMPEKAQELHQLLAAWRKAVGAPMPKPNPRYDPDAKPGTRRRKAGRRKKPKD